MQSEDLIELNFKGLEMRKWNTPTEKAQRADKKKYGHLSGYCYVYSQSNGR